MPTAEVVDAAERRVRNWWPWALLLTAILLGAAAALTFGLMAITSGAGYRWSSDALIPADSEPHSVAVDEGREALLWAWGSNLGHRCTVNDAATGDLLELTPTDRTDERDAGKGFTWVATHSFHPTSDTVTVICPGVSGSTSAAVEPAPRVPSFLAGYETAILVPAGLAFASVVALVGAAVSALVATRRAQAE